MGVEFRMVKMPGPGTILPGERDGGIAVQTSTGEIFVDFFYVIFEEEQEKLSLEEKLEKYRAAFSQEVASLSRNICEDAMRKGRTPKDVILFVKEDLCVLDTEPTKDTYAWAEIGVGCFDEVIDLKQFDPKKMFTDHT